MYVLVIENQNKRQSGYLVIHDEREYFESEQGDFPVSDGEDYYLETPDTSNHFINTNIGEINHSLQKVNLLPFGTVATQYYNKQVDEYLNKGGKKELLFKKSSEHHLEVPSRPVWLFEKKKHYIDLSNDIIKNLRSFEPQRVRYIKTASVELGGQYYTLFDVEELQELFSYDLEKIRSLQIPIDVCKYCGHAFVKTSRDVMCSQCRIEKKGEVEKQRRWNENEANREFAKFTNALRKRSNVGTLSPYYDWITEKRKKGEVTIEWLESWRKIDKGYQKLCRYFKRAEEATEQIDHSEEWEKCYKDFPHKMNDPEKWVNEWLKKIK